MPVGVELLGRAFAEPRLIALAYAYEQATHHRRPPVTTPSLVNPPRPPLSFEVEAAGENDPSPTATAVSARARFTLDWYTLDLGYSMSVAGVVRSDVLGAHIHRGEPGARGRWCFCWEEKRRAERRGQSSSPWEISRTCARGVSISTRIRRATWTACAAK